MDLLILWVMNKSACTISEECDYQGNGPEELGEDYLLPENVPQYHANNESTGSPIAPE